MSKGKILVVEDSATQRALYREFLEKEGYAVIEAGDGEEGVKKAKNESPDVIITDVVMPKMDGLTMLRTLKKDEHMRYIPVICASATYKDIQTRLRALVEDGAEEYFYLPENLDELGVKVAVMMRIRKIYLELLEKNKQLKLFNDAAVGREMKMIELKDKIKALEEELAKVKR
jgi:CheY-like chemotaxis protein